MSETPAPFTDEPTALISSTVIANNEAMVALRREIAAKTGGGGFNPIVMLRTFADIHDVTMEYAHDNELYAKMAHEEFLGATTLGPLISSHLADISIIALAKPEWDDGIDAKWFLERYLLPALDAASDRYTITMHWSQKHHAWEY